MSQIRYAIAQVLTLPLLTGCMIPVSVQMPETSVPAVRDVSVGPGPGADVAQEESPAPVFPAARQAPVEQDAITITGRTWGDAPGVPPTFDQPHGFQVFAPKGEFKPNWHTERLGVTNGLGGQFTFEVPPTPNPKSLIVFYNNTQSEQELSIKTVYVGHDQPTTDLGDVVMGYPIGQTLDGDPGKLKLTFPGGHQETNRVVEVVAMRTIDETGLFTPAPPERLNCYYSEGSSWRSPIEPKTVAVVETDEPSVVIDGLDHHRWYAVRVKMDLPGGGQAVTQVNSFLAGRDASVRISPTWAKGVGAIDIVQRQGTPEEVDAANQAVVEANK